MTQPPSTYAGQFNVMAVGDADAYPDIDVFTASARNELHALA
jgi:diacylglycerol O-acyltransferase